MKVVLCNCPPAAAPQIARSLVERRLAACVNIIPGVRSVYRWNGEIHDDGESTLLIKVDAGGVVRLRDALLALHPYDVPEVLALAIDDSGSNPAYVAWVRSMCASLESTD